MAAVFTWVVLGMLVAGIGKLVAWDEKPLGWVPLLLAGVAGAIGGGFVAGRLWFNAAAPGFGLPQLALATAGAAAVVWLYYSLIGRRQIAASRTTIEHRRAA